MTRLAPLIVTEARLLVRDWTVLVFAFVFPPLVMLILAGVFGTQPTSGFGWRRPDDYYVTASIGVPVIALALVGLPVTLASYRERGVLRRFEAFGISPATVIAAHAVVTCGLVVLSRRRRHEPHRRSGCWPSSRYTCSAAEAHRRAP